MAARRPQAVLLGDDDPTGGGFATELTTEESTAVFSPGDQSAHRLLDREDDLAALHGALQEAISGAGRHIAVAFAMWGLMVVYFLSLLLSLVAIASTALEQAQSSNTPAPSTRGLAR